MLGDDQPPIHTAKDKSKSATPLPETLIARKTTVLIVDDDPDFRDAVRLVLSGDGRVSVQGEAADGREAAETAAQLQPDVILIDLEMPVMNGFHLFKALREGSSRARVIVLTGCTDQGLVERAYSEGAVRYLNKSDLGDLPGLVLAVGRR